MILQTFFFGDYIKPTKPWERYRDLVDETGMENEKDVFEVGEVSFD